MNAEDDPVRHIGGEDTTCEVAAALTGIPAETLRGLRDGALVAVPKGDLHTAVSALRRCGFTATADVLSAMLAAAQEAPCDEGADNAEKWAERGNDWTKGPAR